ncbi:MAG: hypothetical protein US13_C0001G0132 [candidate division TM6 bacterium GW2011_GWE2_36_25]|nr:MAG: hypothetical protein US03_C0001G0072 [candidate division TM6 bacterium GW2011_GWF2_36_131]KKQ03792.1 MAG: hypothetical protein US13_C0001G0132 [candidate division TM6 bacterium GW2011_GWE2_36_25]KKQ19938.1 MAG: hypothetical protein US32_C0003G0055 [candidate division TM6 bacterium GW2011_GWA2_36_9]
MIHAYKTYELLPSAHEYKIVVQETEYTTINGYDSDGKISTHHFTQTRERYLEPKDAFDLGIRYESCSILHAALNKMEFFNEHIDISAALNVIVIKLQEAHSHRKASYWFSGIVGAAATSPWFFSGTTAHKLIASGVIAGFAGLTALAAKHGFIATSKKYKNIIHMLLSSPACIIKNKKQLRYTLAEATSLLAQEDQAKLHILLSCC